MSEQLPGMPLPPPAGPTRYKVIVERFMSSRPETFYLRKPVGLDPSGNWVILEEDSGSTIFFTAGEVSAVAMYPLGDGEL